MDDRTLAELQVRLHGADALNMAIAKAEACKAAGDEIGYGIAVRDLELTKQILEADAAEAYRRGQINPETSNLFAGVANATLDCSRFEISSGFVFERVFAHVMAPYLVAFAPAEAGRPHPPPWKAASGGLGFDIQVQISLDREARPTKFGRLNTLWFAFSLLRLIHSNGIRVPVVANEDWKTAATAQNEPVFWPIELDSNGFAFDGFRKSTQIPTSTLEWIRSNFASGAELMEKPEFNLAFRALDGAQRTSTLAEAMLLIWSSLEALIRPGGQKITHRLCLGIATYIEDDPSKRDQVYGSAKQLYAVRGQITHAAELPTAQHVIASFDLARRCFRKAIENREPPDFPSLEILWKSRK